MGTNCDHPKCDGPRLVKARLVDLWYCTARCRYLDNCRRRQLARRANLPSQREYERNRKLFAKYGITWAQWHELVIGQSGLCAICGGQLSGKMCVDHDHETGQIRGMLCNNCNRALGYFGDDSAILRSAVKYLETASSRVSVGREVMRT